MIKKNNTIDKLQAQIFFEYFSKKIEKKIQILKIKLTKTKSYEKSSIHRQLYALEKQLNIKVA